MDVARPWLAIVLIVVLAGDAVACAIPIRYIKEDLDRLGCSATVQRVIPLVKFLAVGGLVIGLWAPWLGVLACVGMLAYFGVAFSYHARNDDPVAKYVPMFAFVALIAATLIWSYLG